MPSPAPLSRATPPQVPGLSVLPDLAGLAARLDAVADDLVLQSRLARAGYTQVVWDDEARGALDQRLDALDHELTGIVAGLRERSAALRRDLLGAQP